MLVYVDYIREFSVYSYTVYKSCINITLMQRWSCALFSKDYYFQEWRDVSSTRGQCARWVGSAQLAGARSRSCCSVNATSQLSGVPRFIYLFHCMNERHPNNCPWEPASFQHRDCFSVFINPRATDLITDRTSVLIRLQQNYWLLPTKALLIRKEGAKGGHTAARKCWVDFCWRNSVTKAATERMKRFSHSPNDSLLLY